MVEQPKNPSGCDHEHPCNRSWTHDIGNRTACLADGGQWQTSALFKLKPSAVTVYLMRTASEPPSL